MATSDRRNRLSPPLMYVFRAAHKARDVKIPLRLDDSSNPVPGARVRAPQRGAITEKELRGEVAKDIESLMNCVSLNATLNLTEFPTVAKSILNFGFPDIVHRSIDELAASDIDGEIEQVLRRYEPRLVPNTIRVTRDLSVESDGQKIRYIVHGDLICEPLNVQVEFVADVEVTSGKFQIARL